MRPRVSIIIPTKNEERNIASVLVRIPDDVLKYSEVIVVDCSNDLTAKIAEKLGAKVIKTKCGKGRQMMVGVKKARGDIIVFIDGDGAHPPELIPKLLKKVRPGVMVLGTFMSKEIKKMSKINYSAFMAYFAIIKPLFKMRGVEFNGDPLTGFRCMYKKDFTKLKLKSKGFLIETEMNIKAIENSMRIVEIAIPAKYVNMKKNLLESHFLRDYRAWSKMFFMIVKDTTKEKYSKMKEQFFKRIKRFKELYSTSH